MRDQTTKMKGCLARALLVLACLSMLCLLLLAAYPGADLWVCWLAAWAH